MPADTTNPPSEKAAKQASYDEDENALKTAAAGTAGAWFGFWFGTLLFGGLYLVSMWVSAEMVKPLDPNARAVAYIVIGAALTALLIFLVWRFWLDVHVSEYLVATEDTLELHRVRHKKVQKQILQRSQLGTIYFFRSRQRNAPPPHLVFRYKGITTQMFAALGVGGWPYVADWLIER